MGKQRENVACCGTLQNPDAAQNSIAIGGKPTWPDLLSARPGREWHLTDALRHADDVR